jgi:hypothetical protein
MSCDAAAKRQPTHTNRQPQVGTDIEDAKCCWLVCTALADATPEQQEAIKVCSCLRVPACVCAGTWLSTPLHHHTLCTPSPTTTHTHHNSPGQLWQEGPGGSGSGQGRVQGHGHASQV